MLGNGSIDANVFQSGVAAAHSLWQELAREGAAPDRVQLFTRNHRVVALQAGDHGLVVLAAKDASMVQLQPALAAIKACAERGGIALAPWTGAADEAPQAAGAGA